jgi:glucan 1,3-beta-glucosidase
VAIYDAFFDPVSYWNGFMGPSSGVNNVILDTDSYQIFSNSQVAMSPSEHISTACASGPKFASNNKWLVVG